MVVQLFTLLLAVGCLAAFGLGMWLAANPAAVTILDRRLGELFPWLVRPIRVERHIFRNHRWYGGGIVIGSLYVLATLPAILGHHPAWERLAGARSWSVAWEWLLLVAMVGAGFTLAVGVAVLVRPSLLKPFEQWANREVSRRQLAEVWTTLHATIAGFLWSRPRLLAGLIMAASLLALVMLLREISWNFLW